MIGRLLNLQFSKWGQQHYFVGHTDLHSIEHASKVFEEQIFRALS